MRIAHIFWGLGTGGIETMLVNIANEQARLGHEIHVLIINEVLNDKLIEKLSPQIRFKCFKRKVGSRIPYFIMPLNWHLTKIVPDVVHLHGSEFIRFVLPIWRKKSVLTVHNTNPKHEYKYCDLYNHVYSISDSVRNELKVYYNIDSKTIFNGIPVQSFRHRHQNSKIVNIVQVGRLFVNQKGQDILIQAFAKVLKSGFENLTLTFIGEGESEICLKQMVKEYGLENNVRFVGLWQQEYLFEHLADFDLFVQPSRYEGFGLTVAEAIAAKVPVLVSNNQGPMEVINQGMYGYHFKNGNVDDCANVLQTIIQKGCDADMINKAYDYVCRMFDVKQTAKKYIEEYNMV